MRILKSNSIISSLPSFFQERKLIQYSVELHPINLTGDYPDKEMTSCPTKACDTRVVSSTLRVRKEVTGGLVCGTSIELLSDDRTKHILS